MADWFYFQGGTQQGPVSDDQVRGMVASGQLQPQDSVWRQGMANWAPISSVPELMPASAAPPQYGAPPGPAPSYGQPAPAYGQPPQDDYGYERRAPAPAGGVKKITIWSILVVAGAGLWFINAFLPWWGISLNATEEAVKTAGEDGRKQAFEIQKENAEWYVSHLGASAYSKTIRAIFSPTDPTTKASATLLGIHTGAGLFGFIMAFFILGGFITSWFVSIVAAWRWIGAFVFALFGLIILILSMVWLFGTPGADAPPILSQGNSIGPLVQLLASLTLLTGCVLDGIFGLFGFLARLKGGRPASAAGAPM